MAVIRFSSGRTGSLAFIFVATAAFFGIAALDTEFFAQLAQSRTRRNFLPLIEPFSIAGVNVVLAAISLYLLWEAQKYAWQFVQSKAVWQEGETIYFHPTIRKQSVSLDEITSINLEEKTLKRTLRIRLVTGGSIVIRALDRDDAHTFVRHIKARIRAT